MKFSVAVFSALFIVQTAAAAPLLFPGAIRVPGQALSLLGLASLEDGSILCKRIDPATGKSTTQVLPVAQSLRVRAFLSKLPASNPEPAMTAALLSYLKPRMAAKDLYHNAFIFQDSAGTLHLTDAGRNALIDILTAEDGQLLNVPKDGAPLVAAASPAISRGLPQFGSLASVGEAEAALQQPNAAFDASASAPAGAFDWAALDREVKSMEKSKSSAVPQALAGYFVNRDANTVRMMVSAERTAKKDVLAVGPSGLTEEERAAIYEQMGLDGGRFDRIGAKIVRVIDDLLVVDVDIRKAAELGLSLARKGLASVPARLYKRAAATFLDSPITGALGGQFFPIPSEAFKAEGIDVKNADSRAMMRTDALTSAGMHGEGTRVGIIDSGIDENHPDFKGRIDAYVDFSGEGDADTLGHGTHISGTLAGSGAASGGRFRGVADRAHLLIAKVFGSKGDASEDTLLAAMKWMQQQKVDVLNMSVGGPGNANRDPLSAMANRMAVEDNILVVAAAGNKGPNPGTISTPGNGRYVLTVSGVNKSGQFSFFPSRGPVIDVDGNVYQKPDLSTVTGDVIAPPPQPKSQQSIWARLFPSRGTYASPVSMTCVYGPGVISTRSSADSDPFCGVEGNSYYRFLSGTSMAVPMASGVAADIIGYMKGRGVAYRTAEVKAAMEETAIDLGVDRASQGAGLVNGNRLVAAVTERVAAGLPIGNIAYELAMRMVSGPARDRLKGQTRYQETPLGLFDTRTGHLVNTEREMQEAVDELRKNGSA